MAKLKKNRISSDKVNNKDTKNAKKTLNPFEVHINKEKIKVLGRKLKNDRGLPGVSRAKALKKRKHTLLQEYKLQNKSNRFLDRRFGERNPALTQEDKALARFAAERVKAHKKKSIFNLADDEVLTHRGQVLSEIEKFVDERSDDEDSLEGDKSGKLDSSFVEDAHFGGGILKNTGKEGAKTHKELIEELIAESKKRKAEKQKIKEATLELTEKLDAEWKDLLPLVNKNPKKSEAEVEKRKVDDYDKVMRELKFEARGIPSDRLKSEDEIAKEEKEKLEALEKERLERMKGIVENGNTKQTHRSADDLDDDFVYDSDPDVTLSYNEKGEANVSISAEITRPKSEDEDVVAESDDEDNEEEQSEDEENDQNESSEDEEESTDDLSDLKNESESEESEEDIEENEEESKFEDEENSEKNGTLSAADANKIKSDLKERKAMMEKARSELPYTFDIPESYEDFQKLLQNQTSIYQGIILERMIKCNHPSLGENNKQKLAMVFVYLLQHLSDIFSDMENGESIQQCFKTFAALLPHIYDLAQFSPENAHNSMIEVIKEKQGDYRKRKSVFPGIDVLVYLKLVSCLFTTSDFRHQVVTPCVVFIEQMLNKCKVRSRKDAAYGLFLTTLLLEYTSLSKRYLPSAINFLAGILHMTIPKSGVRLIKVMPPFKSTSAMLVLVDKVSECNTLKLEISDLLDSSFDDGFKIRAAYIATKQLMEFHENLNTLPSCPEIFENTLRYLRLIPKENYPFKIKEAFEQLTKVLEESVSNRDMQYIVMEKKRPKALKLYEPKIEPVYDYKKHKVQSREKAERDKLLHKIKKEKKGALREIRRDQAFLGRIKINQRIQSDIERKRKVNEIYASANIQQSELNALDRKKKKKK